jgi:polyisoprenoid-binding protein YceI
MVWKLAFQGIYTVFLNFIMNYSPNTSPGYKHILKKVWFIVIALVSFIHAKSQDVYLSTNGTVSFFSETPLENIDAVTNQAVGALNVKTKSVFFKAKMSTFEFKKSLMQEHFNENYMESEKYPFATFNGSINEDVDLTLDSTYEVTVTGKFSLHGIDQDRTIPGTIVVKNGSIEVTSAFDVMVSDHEIKIPSVVSQNIAETVRVKVYAEMMPTRENAK